MTTTANWFDVDKNGLADLVARRGKVFIFHELLQNSWDCADATEVSLTIGPEPGRPFVNLVVEDNSPDGFKNLSHAYTLFAPSEKKGDASRRGRFNLGEKLVLALCEEASISSTTGTIVFEAGGRRKGRNKRACGTVFSARVRMTREELDEALREIKKIAPPPGTKTIINGQEVLPRRAVIEYATSLATELADETGAVRRRYRETIVSLYNLRQGEKALLFEMGIPVMELGDDPYHVDVGQKVPMGMERDSVTPHYLKELRAGVLDHMHKNLSEEAARGKWASDGLEQSSNPEAVKSLITKRFGDKAVIYDPSDHEGNQLAASRGFTVIAGGSFTGEGWEKIREYGAALPAGQVTPSPKPFSPDGTPLKLIPEEEWTPAMCGFHDFAARFASDVAHLSIGVEFTKDIGWAFNGCYSKNSSISGQIIINLGRLGLSFFTDFHAQLRFLIHELGHHWGGHLDEEYHKKLCWLAAEALRLATTNNNFFNDLKSRHG
jgi:hypothetical protein